MTVPRPRQKKPSDIDEIVRVARLFALLADGLMDIPLGKSVSVDKVIEIAERIAARTEDSLGDHS